MKTGRIRQILAVGVSAAAVGIASVPAQAASLKSSLEAGVFDTTTTVEFDLVETRGRDQSTFGVLDVVNNSFTSLFAEVKGWDGATAAKPNVGQREIDWIGTCGDSILSCSTSFTFEGGKEYKLGFWNGSSLYSLFKAQEDSYTYTTTADDFNGPAATKTVSGLGKVFVGAEDGSYKPGGVQVNDYQDFVISASVPEPSTTTALLLIGVAGIFGARRRR